MRKKISFFIALAISASFFGSAGAGPGPCPNAAVSTDLAAPMPRLAGRLLTHQPIVIVAIGSSSTAGAGATSAQFSYPMQLQAELQRLWPDQPVTVINRGINGEDAADMRRRFTRDVFAEHPDLVVWQLGTNYLMRNDGVGGFADQIQQGVDAIRSRGIDVVLMDPQYAPKVLSDPDADSMVSLIGAVAHERHVGLFRRFDLMSEWVRTEDMSFGEIITADGLHMNDWSYGCVAQGLATALNRAARNSMIGRADNISN
jgi:lysophospholipase L1-like esterase